MMKKAYGSSQSPEITGRYRVGDVRHALCDVTKARTRLSFSSCVPLDKGLEQFVRWTENQDRTFNDFARAKQELNENGLYR
jgi:dTDP-L-rhamnose 4-epimerase